MRTFPCHVFCVIHVSHLWSHFSHLSMFNDVLQKLLNWLASIASFVTIFSKHKGCSDNLFHVYLTFMICNLRISINKRKDDVWIYDLVTMPNRLWNRTLILLIIKLYRTKCQKFSFFNDFIFQSYTGKIKTQKTVIIHFSFMYSYINTSFSW